METFRAFLLLFVSVAKVVCQSVHPEFFSHILHFDAALGIQAAGFEDLSLFYQMNKDILNIAELSTEACLSW